MLSRNPSLTLRATFVFVAVYGAIFAAVLILMSAANFSVDGDGHHSGPSIALSFAAADLREESRGIRFADDGSFARLAARNPSLWVFVEKDGRHFAFGSGTAGARHLFNIYSGTLDRGKFHVPDLPRPLSDSMIRQHSTARGNILIAAGGVNPATLTLADSFRYFVREGLFPLLVLGGVGLAAMAFALYFLALSLQRVAADAAAISAERPDRRLEESKVPLELLPLVQRFNAALDRLSGELGRRKRFIADVAHELRTPLAIASLQVDSLKNKEERRSLKRVMTRMSHLVAQMLDVERLSLAERHRTEIDLNALASDVVADMAPTAMEAGYDLSLQAPPHPVKVSGDFHALSRALGNLIGNAVAHGGGKGQIQIVVGPRRTIDVIDDGPGVPSGLHSRLFEPFCREYQDRDGCGLGLHLTREIMRAHGGNACFLDGANGTRFRLEFP